MPHWSASAPHRDTVLYPAVSYPSYAMGAQLAGARGGRAADLTGGSTSTTSPGRRRPGPVPVGRTLREPDRGGLDDLGPAAAWGRNHGVPVFSDECYVEFTWDGPCSYHPQVGCDGVVAVHSLSKRSNLAGGRLRFFAGDRRPRRLPRRSGGTPGSWCRAPVEAAAVAPGPTTTTSTSSGAATTRRLEALAHALGAASSSTSCCPAEPSTCGCRRPAGMRGRWPALAERAGGLVTPGGVYGKGGRGYVRIAVGPRRPGGRAVPAARGHGRGQRLTGGRGRVPGGRPSIGSGRGMMGRPRAA